MAKDPKTTLQELLQANALALPVYDLVATRGDDHEKVFEVVCSIEVIGLEDAGQRQQPTRCRTGGCRSHSRRRARGNRRAQEEAQGLNMSTLIRDTDLARLP